MRTVHVLLLHNGDHALPGEDPGRAAREEIVHVAAAIQEALKGPSRTLEVVTVEPDLRAVHDAVARHRPDVVFNLSESLAADSRGEVLVPTVLELLGLPFTGSSSMSLTLSLHKHKTKEILRARNVPTPDFKVVERVVDLLEMDLTEPQIVKPVREDASLGIDFDSVTTTRAALGRAVTRVLRTFKQPALVERYIEGREIYVSLLGNSPRRALPITEIAFGPAFAGKPRVLSYSAKWDAESPECVDSPALPAHLDKDLQRRCIEVATAAFEALECRDYGRIDLRVDERGQPFVIDVNPNCDLHPQAGFARAAEAAGISYADLAVHLLELALERSHGHQAARSARPSSARRAPQPHRDVLGGRGAMRARADRRRSQSQ